MGNKCCCASRGYTSVVDVQERDGNVQSNSLVDYETAGLVQDLDLFAGIDFERKATLASAEEVEQEEESNEGFGLLGFTPASKIHRKSRIMIVDSTDLPEHSKRLKGNK
ncbi:uncharacterized protein LOC120341442 [Styela clava]